jgi:hypothetical protein
MRSVTPTMMPLARLRLFAINSFIALILAILLLDALPATPLALRLAMEPTIVRLGIHQGPWNLFAPDPDRTNRRVLAEITYRDGRKLTWVMPDPRQQTNWQKWALHRHRDYIDHLITQEAEPAWEPFCRYLARTLRPDLPQADRGAEVRVIYEEAEIPVVEGPIAPLTRRLKRMAGWDEPIGELVDQPWRSYREPTPFTSSGILTIERLD